MKCKLCAYNLIKIQQFSNTYIHIYTPHLSDYDHSAAQIGIIGGETGTDDDDDDNQLRTHV